MSPGAANFVAGGMASNMYWFSALRESSPLHPPCNLPKPQAEHREQLQDY